MMDEKAMRCLVNAYRNASNLDDGLINLGFTTTPCFDIAGDIADAIYYMLGENTETFDESVTAQTLWNAELSNDQCGNILLQHCRR